MSSPDSPPPSPDAVRYAIGEVVQFVLDPETSGIVTGIVFRPGCVNYIVQSAGGEEEHYDFELKQTSIAS